VLEHLRRGLEGLYRGRLKGLVLYGSQAREDAVSGADVDVMVLLDGPVDAGKEILRCGVLTAEISLEHDVVVSCLFMDQDRYLNEQSPLLLNVRREGVRV
jgi:predicted nucleotidyltransferase